MTTPISLSKGKRLSEFYQPTYKLMGIDYHEWASKHDNEIYDKIIDQVINVIKEVN